MNIECLVFFYEGSESLLSLYIRFITSSVSTSLNKLFCLVYPLLCFSFFLLIFFSPLLYLIFSFVLPPLSSSFLPLYSDYGIPEKLLITIKELKSENTWKRFIHHFWYFFFVIQFLSCGYISSLLFKTHFRSSN